MKEFISIVEGSKSLYGMKTETLDSLILDMLPSLGHTYTELKESSGVDDTQNASTYLVMKILDSLRSNAGFHIPEVRCIDH